MPDHIRKLISQLFDFILDVDSFVLQFYNRCLHCIVTEHVCVFKEQILP